MLSRIIASALVWLGLSIGAFAQAPQPVPALPDSARLTSYSISSSTCACSVGFQIYGSGTDVDEWIQVYVNGVAKLSTDPVAGWSLSSVTGSLGSIPRPITNAVLTFNAAQTATVVIVGDERPRRLSQFPENRGVAARDLNQAITDAVAVQRELWDKSNRSITGQPGEVLPSLPPAASRPNTYLCFDSSGLPIVCQNVQTGVGVITLPGSSVNGDSVCFNGTTGASFSDCGWKITGTPSAGKVPSGTGTAGAAIWSGGCLNIQAFGGVGDGVTNNDSAWTATVAALGSAGGCISFPSGKYRFNSRATKTFPNSLYSISILGAGVDQTTLTWPNATGGLQFTQSSLENSIHIRDLTLTTSQVGSGTAIELDGVGTGTTAGYWASDITNVNITGADISPTSSSDYWSIGVLISSWSVINITNLNTVGPVGSGGSAGGGVGLEIGGTGTTAYATVINVTQSSFDFHSIGVLLGNYWQGLFFSNCEFNGESGTVAFSQASGAAGILSLLSITNSQFNYAGNQIDIESSIDNVTITGSTITVFSNNGIGAKIATGLFTTIIGNLFNTAGSPTGTIGALINSSTNNVIQGNTFYLLTAGLELLTASAQSVVSGNIFYGSIAVSILYSSVNNGNILTNNIGYNPVGVTNSTTVGASPATICAGPSPETHYYSQSATNTATVKLTNTSGPVIGTMASGTTVVAQLGSNECVFVTWTTTAPTYAKSVH